MVVVVVVVDTAVVAVVAAMVVVVGATVVVVAMDVEVLEGADSVQELALGTNAKPPSNNSGAIAIDKRFRDWRTHRSNTAPDTSAMSPAMTTPVVVPVVGNLHISAAIIILCSVSLH